MHNHIITTYPYTTSMYNRKQIYAIDFASWRSDGA